MSGQSRERRQKVRRRLTRQADRQRGCVYALPLAELAEQVIGVPAEVTPAAPTGAQNEPGCTTFCADAGAGGG